MGIIKRCAINGRVTIGATHIGYQLWRVQSGEGQEIEAGKKYRPEIKRLAEPRGSLPLGKGEYGSADARQGVYQL